MYLTNYYLLFVISMVAAGALESSISSLMWQNWNFGVVLATVTSGSKCSSAIEKGQKHLRYDC
jgi:hypothetical protein